MGWTVLYIAFGCVALWLLGEVLLQYKARLRWRLLAFGGFLCVVLGVLMSDLIVIFVGTAAFAAGQLFVTLSFRRGFSTGWAIGGKPGSSRRRRSQGAAGGDDGPPPATDSDPVLEVSQLEETATYQPLPLPDDTGQYGVYERDEQSAPSSPPMGSPQAGDYTTTGYDELGAYDTGSYDPLPYGTPAQGTPAYGTPAHGTPSPVGDYGAAAYGDTSHGIQHTYSSPLYSAAPGQPYPDPYGYGGEQYGSYAAPYGGQSTTGQTSYPGANDLYDPLSGAYQGEASAYQGEAGGYQGEAGGYQGEASGYQGEAGGYSAMPYAAPGQSGSYDTGGYPADPYPRQTPPDGVWMPQQREADPGLPYPPRDTDEYGYYYDPQRP